MADTRTPSQRRRIMQSVKTKDTGPEMAVRRLLHREGFRYRLHHQGLPGRPDIVFPGRRKVIFVHGCFWHGHDCRLGRPPKSKLEYWGPKLLSNKERDQRILRELAESGWATLTVWQCEMENMAELRTRLIRYLEDAPEKGG
ncbi:DNA mismatch endonuclease Vsr [Altererythrobacter sp. BO-6]|uniref:very short patch repair endonuclease n=1 Tax=Altererythrobacter sp. BO-6 TaxID=2604537 RepID=UPI0013E0F469|nr:DNA mismatch endonuclease Vsr [Altererythrobacter sp. BO-6]QIG53905.1 DNA mismatch endonuclease Vsr [Altererythrobacter sp. BO-6]